MGFGNAPLTVVPEAVIMGAIRDVVPTCRDSIEDLIYALTRWESKVKERQVISPERMITVEGADYEDAVAKTNKLCLENAWGDGLPLLPATEERVKWLLTGTNRPRDQFIGKVGPRNRLATVEAIAVGAAMAGARPEYMPVIIAAMEVLTKPEAKLAELQGTTHPVAPAVIVNGPIAKKIGINSGFGCLGPSSEFPAGASIGRAIRLILQNVGGAVPGVTNMHVHGQPGMYTGLVLAEAEDLSPWKPLNVERGFAAGTNTVTILGVGGTHNICRGALEFFVENMPRHLMRLANNIGIAYFNYPWCEDMNAGILLIPPAFAKILADHGYSKEAVKQFLFEHARLSISDVNLMVRHPTRKPVLETWLKEHPNETTVPIAPGPEKFIIVVAGGNVPQHCVWMPCFFAVNPAITQEIK